MKRLSFVLLLLAIWACPGMLHASFWHKTQRKVVPHHVVAHPRTRHYTRKAQPHRVVKHVRVRHYTRKARVHKETRHLRKAQKHKKVGRR